MMLMIADVEAYTVLDVEAYTVLRKKFDVEAYTVLAFRLTKRYGSTGID